jgi:hypothetical protein
MISNSAERRQRIKEQSKEVANYMNCITPPSELVRKWQIKIEYSSKRADREAVVAQLFQLGADMELEACCEYLTRCAAWEPEDIQEMRDLRRPKPPSLKAQALDVLDHTQKGYGLAEVDLDTIRRALEALPD